MRTGMIAVLGLMWCLMFCLNLAGCAAPTTADVKPSFKEGSLQLCKPDYPRQARALNQQGTVKLHFKIAQDGSLLSVDILQSSGFKLLDLATVNALSHCQFNPAKSQGKPVDGEFDQVFVWKLE